eukprot:gene66055-90386_t
MTATPPTAKKGIAFEIDADEAPVRRRPPPKFASKKLTTATSEKVSFVVGSKVEVNVKGKGKFYSGRIKHNRGDDTYDIDYNDGEQELRVPANLIRAVESTVDDKVTHSIKSKSSVLSEGMKVEANYKGKGKFYPGVIR